MKARGSAKLIMYLVEESFYTCPQFGKQVYNIINIKENGK